MSLYFAGLIPSPLMSPAQQALLFTQAGLTSPPSVISGVLPFMTPFHGAPSVLEGAGGSGGVTGSKESGGSGGGGGESSKMEELSRAEYYNHMKGSSLSRTHSR